VSRNQVALDALALQKLFGGLTESKGIAPLTWEEYAKQARHGFIIVYKR